MDPKLSCGPFFPCDLCGNYDFDSTMHYFSKQGSQGSMATTIRAKNNPQQRMGNLNGLSAGHIATLRNKYC
jgi:hypothetical protein